jgi:hypothetical protein
MRTSLCLSVRPSVCMCPITTTETIRLVQFYEIQRGGQTIECDIDAMFNVTPSTVPKWMAFKPMRETQNLHKSKRDDYILYADRSLKYVQL